MSFNMKVWLGLALALISGAEVTEAATVTVNATQATGGGVYQTLREAVNDRGNWGNGNNDTILITDNAVNVIAERIDFGSNPGPNLLIRNADGDQPIVRVNTSSVERAFDVFDGTITFEGITFIGQSGVPPTLAGGRALFYVNEANGLPVNFSLRNCRVLANAGGDQPRATIDGSISATGGFYYGMLDVGDGPITGPLNIEIENCTVAHLNTAITWEKQPESIATLSISNTLFASIVDAAQVRFSTGNYSDMTTTFTNCAFLNIRASGINQRGVIIFDTGAGNWAFEDVIFEQPFVAGGGAIGVGIEAPGSNTFNGRVTLRRVTASLGRRILQIENIGNDAEIQIEDLIWGYPGNEFQGRAFLVVPTSTTAAFSIDGFAALNGQYNDSLPADWNASIQALYGGAGPVPDDPAYARAVTNPADGSTTGWNSTSNTLFDVSSPVFGDKAADGGPLSGGAEYLQGAVNRARNWSLY